MKQFLFLKKYEYAIPASSAVLSAKPKKTNQALTEHRPLLQVVFDFENSSLRLKGDWQFMVAANKNNEPAWFNYHKGRVSIDAALYLALCLNLNDEASDGLIVPLKGCIKDGEFLSSCSGLLTVSRIRDGHGPQWTISCYLCDLQFADCEIKFEVPVYM